MAASTRTPQETPPRDQKSLPALIRDIANDAATLLRQEITLAKVEIRRNVKDLFGHLGQLAMGGGVALVGLLVLVAFLVVGLGVLLNGAYWLSSLIVALALLVGGGGLGYLGAKRLASRPLAPTATIEAMGETGEWAGQELRDFRASLAGRTSGGAARGDEWTRQPLPSVRSAPQAVRRGPSSESGKTRGGPGQPPLSQPIHKRVLHEIGDDDVMGQAAKVAFYMFSSLPPALLVIFALTGLFGGQGVANFLTAKISGALPGSPTDPTSAAGFISQFVDEVVHNNAPGPLSIGLVLGLWASSAVFVALTEALNKAFDVVEDRSWLRKRALAIGVMAAFAVLFLGGSVVLLGGPRIADALQLGDTGGLVWGILQWPLAFALVVLAFFLAYYLLPNRDQSGCRKVLLKASAISAALWLVATAGFRFYIGSFGSYSETYGFVGAVMVLLLWMYLTGAVILVGGEISSEMERES